MKYLPLFGVTLLFLLEVAICAPTTEDEVDRLVDELTERLLKRKLARLDQREYENHKREMLKSAAELTQAQMKSEPKASNPGSKLGKFLESNPTIRRRGLAARTQLNVIQAYRKEWVEKRGTSNPEEFWTLLNAEFNGHILHTRESQVSDVTAVKPIEPDYTQCPFTQPSCTGNTRFRTFDGTCNNVDHPLWGSTNRAQIRLLPASYSDGIETIRTAQDGSELPSAREVANEVLLIRETGEPGANNEMFTYMGMQFGQFLDHDMTSTPEASVDSGTGGSGEIDCGVSPEYGPSTVFVNCQSTNKQCLPIKIPENDPNFQPGACMKFIRSEAILRDNCDITPRFVPNSITAWLDLSSVYGSDAQKAEQLRDPNTGKMKTENYVDSSNSNNQVNNLLPRVPNADSHCSAAQSDHLCFDAGDKRSNEQIGLTSIHTVFVRMHNHILQKLKNQDSTLQPTELYQMSRKILIGLWQHMVYKEYLPTILGREVVQKYGLSPRRDGFSTSYNKSQTPDIITSFSTAAFRMGHTEIRSFMKLVSLLYEHKEEMALSEIQFNPTKLYTGPTGAQMSGIDSVLLGLVNSSIAHWDRFFSDQVRNHLFANDRNSEGFDLAARNIQRGRDHGLPGYLDFRKFCGFDNVRPTDFDQLKNLDARSRRNEKTVIEAFKEVYGHVEDIDLYAGAMAELNIPGANVGETFACIMGLQFKGLKHGDGFYYENQNSDTGFSEDQLREIRKFTLARLLCDTLDSKTSMKIQPQVLRKAGMIVRQNAADIDNTRKSCSEIPDMDYSKFRSGTSGSIQPPPPPPSGGGGGGRRPSGKHRV